MGIMGSSYGFPVHMNFMAPPGVVPVDPSAFITPQEKAAAEKKARGGPGALIDQALAPAGVGQTPMSGQAAAGGVPGQGGGASMDEGGDSPYIKSIMQGLGVGGSAGGAAAPTAAGAGAAGSSGMMATIAKLLPMFLGV